MADPPRISESEGIRVDQPWIGLDQAWFGSDQAWIRVNPPTLAPLPAIIKTQTQTSQRRRILNQ